MNDQAQIDAKAAASRQERRKRSAWTVCAILVAASGLVQLFIVMAGFKGWPVYTDYYRRLTDAFLHGQISLREQPAPQLLALKDPYDPKLNGPWRQHDITLFNGKFYLYWGPAPALLAAGVCLVIGDFNPTYGDQYMVFLFLFGTTVLAAVLIFQIRARLFPDQSPWSTAFPIITLGMGTPVLYSLARAAVYEASIASGQFFLIAGLLAAWFGLRNQKTPFIALAGACWTLCVGSRIGLAPAVAVITLLTAWRLRASAAKVAVLLTPLLAGALLYAWYNDARFGSPTEIGLRYELAAINQHAMRNSDFSSWRFAFPHLLQYLFSPPYLIKVFPYVLAYGQWTSETAIHAPQSRESIEPLTGLIWTTPFFLFAIAAPAAWRRLKARPDGELAAWAILSLSAGVVLGIAPALTVHGVTMRYLLDSVPCLAVLSAIGFWATLECVAESRFRLRREVSAAARLMTLLAVVLGLLMGMNGYYRHFWIFNPTLFLWLRDTLPVVNW